MFSTFMTLQQLEKMADSIPLRSAEFLGLAKLKHPLTEEQLYELELARLAERQCGERMFKNPYDQRQREIRRHLTRELIEYEGIFVPAYLGHNLVIRIRPRYY